MNKQEFFKQIKPILESQLNIPLKKGDKVIFCDDDGVFEKTIKAEVGDRVVLLITINAKLGLSKNSVQTILSVLLNSKDEIVWYMVDTSVGSYPLSSEEFRLFDADNPETLLLRLLQTRSYKMEISLRIRELNKKIIDIKIQLKTETNEDIKWDLNREILKLNYEIIHLERRLEQGE